MITKSNYFKFEFLWLELHTNFKMILVIFIIPYSVIDSNYSYSPTVIFQSTLHLISLQNYRQLYLLLLDKHFFHPE